MIEYNPSFLEFQSIFSAKELNSLEALQKEMALSHFLKSKTLNAKLGFDFIYSSAQIEGNTYTKAETLALLEMGITAGGKKYSDALMVLNLKLAFEKIMCGEIKINRESLHTLHSVIAKDLVQECNLGVMRKTSIDGISGCNYVPLPSGERLYTEMEYLFNIYQQIKNPFERAMYLHNNLAYLQYFEDCNKRTARAMQFISLKNDGIMPLILTRDSRELYTQYREALVYYYETGSYKLSKDFFIQNYAKMQGFFNTSVHHKILEDKISKRR